MYNPWKYRILWEIVVRPTSKHIYHVKIMYIWYLSHDPTVCDCCQLHFYDFLTFLSKVPKNSLSSCLILKNKQKRIGITVKPNFYSNILEKIPIPCDKLYLPVGKLYFFMVRTIDKREKLDSSFKHNKLTIMRSLYYDSPSFDNVRSSNLLLLIGLQYLLCWLLLNSCYYTFT